jgi:hypothetical protein
MQSQAQHTMVNADRMIDLAKDMIDDIQDGVTVKLVRDPDQGSIMDFVTGKIDELPLKISIEIQEDD